MTEQQQTSMAATYLVAAKLALMGYNAVVTSRNMKGTDILVENPRNGRSVAVQIKGNRKSHTDFLIGKDISRQRIYVLVNIWTEGRKRGEVEYFVVPGADAARLKKVQPRPNSTWYYIQRTSVERYREAWGAIQRAAGRPES